MGNELISRDALIEDIQAAVEHGGMGALVAGSLKRYVLRRPAVDAVEVVRCKDCEHIKEGRFDIFKLAYCDLWKTDMQMDNYCCFGNRRADE